MQTPKKRERQQKIQFGDFQTPLELAAKVCQIAKLHVPAPKCIIEPTCGIGRILSRAQLDFPSAKILLGADINNAYLEQAKQSISAQVRADQKLQLIHRSFFDINWPSLASKQGGEILVIGNPPWVTSATLGKISSTNRPLKTKQKELRGLDAVTGKSNFDISEWIALELLRSLPLERAWIALILKTAVARKLLKKSWQRDLPLCLPRIYRIDARREFGASVDACLLTAHISESGQKQCPVYTDLDPATFSHTIGYDPPTLIAHLEKHQRTRDLRVARASNNWRSGIKHDCAKALELTIQGSALINGFGQEVSVESEFVYPLKKSSDVATRDCAPTRRVIVTQRSTSESPLNLQDRAPRLWNYLQRHKKSFDTRRSSIYRSRPPFSIFGVGAYSFAPHKVAISGLYKHLRFQQQGPIDQMPVLYDDTVYFLSFENEEQARAVHDLLCSQQAQDFLNARIFWDAKRPITASVLRSLCLEKLGKLSDQALLSPRT